MSEEKDLFENYSELPKNVINIIDAFEQTDMSYKDCDKLIENLNRVGYTCDYGLDSTPFGLKKIKWEIILTDIELNEEFIPNSDITYDILFNGIDTFKAVINDPDNNRGYVSFNDAPKELRYRLDKSLNDFTDSEKQHILDYRGLDLGVDGFEVSDIFMEKSNISLLFGVI